MLIEGQPLPKHVAIIMDGNGRWAKDRGLARTEGHREGMRTVVEIVKVGTALGIKALTLYAFSEQNWARPEDEVGGLMKLLVEYLITEREMFFRDQVRLRAVGRISRLPLVVRQTLHNVEAVTANHKGLTLTLCLSYGGREEVSDVVKELGTKVVEGSLAVDDIDEQLISRHSPSLVPGTVDLLIRTGGEQRTSNFLIWAGVNADLYFSPKLWPDYRRADLEEAIASAQRRHLASAGRLVDVA